MTSKKTKSEFELMICDICEARAAHVVKRNDRLKLKYDL